MSKIAVIGVHGVGNQEPGETARAVASLLQSDSSPEAWSCGGFAIQTLSLPIEKLFSCNNRSVSSQPAVLHDSVQPTHKFSGIMNLFDERSPHQRAMHEEPKRKAAEKKAAQTEGASADGGGSSQLASGVDASIPFMKDQVVNYDPRDASCMDRENFTYETICLSGRRQPTKPPLNDQKIDVYEFYWADLSRLGKGMFEVLVNFYQLIFHLCSLGRNVLDEAEPDFYGPERKREWRWWLARKSHAATNFGLTLVAPILNLCLLAVLLILLPANVPEKLHFATGIGASVLFLLGVWIVGRSVHGGHESRRILGSTIKIVGLVGGVAMGAIAIYFRSEACYHFLTVLWLLLATVGICYAIFRYSAVKQQAKIVGGVILVFMWSIVIWRLRSESNTYEDTALVAMQTGVVLLLALVANWLAIGGCVLFVAALSWAEWFFLESNATRKKRALGTAFLSLILPISLFAAVTISVYTPLLFFATGKQDAKPTGIVDQFTNALRLPSVEFCLPYFETTLGFLRLDLSTKRTLPEVANWMFVSSTTILYPFLLLFWLFAAGLAIRSFHWSAIVESSRPHPKDLAHSKIIGAALTRGFRTLGWVFALLLFGFPITLWVGGLIKPVADTFSIVPSWTYFYGIVVTFQGMILAALVLTGKLDNVARIAWPPLDIILDVDNYLRGRPSNRTPKARIAARYVALLRHVASQGYDKVVIVAHSQGTVITADLLRFLRSFPEPRLKALGFDHVYSSPTEPHHFDNLFLITMGCPLRQLYGWRFPNLYAWARHDGYKALAPTPPPEKGKKGTVTTGGGEPGSQAAEKGKGTDSNVAGNVETPRKPDPHSAATDHGSESIGSECKPDPRALGVKRWINAYCSGDYVGRNLWRDDKLEKPTYNDQVLYQPWDGSIATESLDRTETDYTRRELCFGVGAHTHYFQDNGQEILTLINQILT